jgi:hypothetical protein
MNLQQEVSQLPFKAKILAEYEPSFFFGTYAQYELVKRLNIGPTYNYYYTGSRIGQRDYSGSFSSDQYLYTHAFGFKVDYLLARFSQFDFTIQLNTGINFTKWRGETKLIISEESINMEGEFNSIYIQSYNNINVINGVGWYALPAICFDYHLSDRISLVSGIGYSFDFLHYYKHEFYKDIKLTSVPDWSGLRLSLGLEFKL